MSSLFLLDTNMVSYMVSGASAAARGTLARQGANTVCVSAITEAELRFGMAKRPNATARMGMIELFLRKVNVVPWGRKESAVYGQLRARLEAAGALLGSLDMLIATHAMAMEAVLVTHDGGFRRLSSVGFDPPLPIVDWATDLPSAAPQNFHS